MLKVSVEYYNTFARYKIQPCMHCMLFAKITGQINISESCVCVVFITNQVKRGICASVIHKHNFPIETGLVPYKSIKLAKQFWKNFFFIVNRNQERYLSIFLRV